MLSVFPADYVVSPYGAVLLFAVAVVVLCLAFSVLPSFLAIGDPSRNKVLPYECGIDVDDYEITQFDIRFYLVAMLFLVFDCEVIFLFPWCLVVGTVSFGGFLSVMFFLFVLTAGLAYEWLKGSLDW